MRGSIARIIAFGALVGPIVGCSPVFDFQGEWTGERQVEIPAGVDPSVVRAVAKVRLLIRGSTFDLLEGGTTKFGSVRYERGRAFLRVTSHLGRPLGAHERATLARRAEIVLKPLSRDRILYLDRDGFDPAPLELSRSSKP